MTDTSQRTAPLAIPQNNTHQVHSRDRSSSLSGLISSLGSSFSKSPAASSSNESVPPASSLERSSSLSSDPSSHTSYSELESRTPKDVSPVTNLTNYHQQHQQQQLNNIKSNDELEESPSELGFFGPRAYHARRQSWSQRPAAANTSSSSNAYTGPSSAPTSDGVDLGSSPTSIMAWLHGLNPSPTSKTQPLPPLDGAHKPVSAASPPKQHAGAATSAGQGQQPGSSNLGNLFRRMSLGSSTGPAKPAPATAPVDMPAPAPAASTAAEPQQLPQQERGREPSQTRRKPAPRRLSPTSERMLRGAYNDLS